MTIAISLLIIIVWYLIVTHNCTEQIRSSTQKIRILPSPLARQFRNHQHENHQMNK